MKKTLFAAAVVAASTFSACSESSTDTTDQQQETTQPAGEASTAVVVETPIFESVAEPFQTQVEELVSEYMQLKDALVASDAEAAQAAAAEVLRVARAMPIGTLTTDEKAFAEEHTAEAVSSAEQIAAATNLEAQRAQLGALSESVFSMAKAYGAAEGTLYYQHCPMALNNEGGYWLSSNEEIQNPYFGESMMRCGSTQEVYKK